MLFWNCFLDDLIQFYSAKKSECPKTFTDIPGSEIDSPGRAIFTAEVLNFCVRDGNRCDHFAIATRSFQVFSLKTE